MDRGGESTAIIFDIHIKPETGMSYFLHFAISKICRYFIITQKMWKNILCTIMSIIKFHMEYLSKNLSFNIWWFFYIFF